MFPEYLKPGRVNFKGKEKPCNFLINLNNLSNAGLDRWSNIPFDKSPGKPFLLKGNQLISFMEQAGGYFFGQCSTRGKPGLDAPTDCQSLDRTKYRVGMHATEFCRPEDFGYGTLTRAAKSNLLSRSHARTKASLDP
jgi:hypothetical protein